MSDNTIKIELEISTVDENVIVKTSSSQPITTSSQIVQVSCNAVPESENKYDKVFIYDIDDLTLLSEKQLENIAVDHPKLKMFPEFMNLVKRAISSVKISDPNEEEHIDFLNIKDAVENGIYAMKMIVRKYGFLKCIYGMMMRDKRRLFLDPDATFLVERWECVKKCLELTNERSGKLDNKKYANVVLSGGGITRGAAQIVFSGLSSNIPVENIYSTATRSTQSVLEIIRKKFGEYPCKFIVVTSNKETIDAAKKLFIPAWPVNSDIEFEELYNQQRDFWLLKNQEESGLELRNEQVEQREHAYQLYVKEQAIKAQKQEQMDRANAEIEARTKIQHALNGALAQAQIADAQIGEQVDGAFDRAIDRALTIESRTREKNQQVVNQTLSQARKAEVEARAKAMATVQQQLEQVMTIDKIMTKNRGQKSQTFVQDKDQIEKDSGKVMADIRTVDPPRDQFQQAQINKVHRQKHAQQDIDRVLAQSQKDLEVARARTQQAFNLAIAQRLDRDSQTGEKSQVVMNRMMSDARRAEARAQALASMKSLTQQLAHIDRSESMMQQKPQQVNYENSQRVGHNAQQDEHAAHFISPEQQQQNEQQQMNESGCLFLRLRSKPDKLKSTI